MVNIIASAAAMVAEARPGVSFITPVASDKLRPLIEQQLADAGITERVQLVDGRSIEAMSAADVVLQASGTAVLEAALLQKPTVATYRVAPLTYWIVIGLGMLKLSHYTLPNLLTETPLVPEFMQGEALPAPIADEVIALLDDEERRQSIASRFGRLRQELALDADQRAADAVLELARL